MNCKVLKSVTGLRDLHLLLATCALHKVITQTVYLSVNIMLTFRPTFTLSSLIVYALKSWKQSSPCIHSSA